MILFAICGFSLLQLQAIPTASQVTVARASYGDVCGSGIRCDSRKHLTCSSGKCTCLIPDTMMFDQTTNSCVVLAGERCLYTTSIQEEQTWTDELHCIENATCNNGLCNCNLDYFEVANGTCQLRRQFGEECLANEMCDTSKNLVCSEQKLCICGNNSINFDSRCIVLAGQNCTKEQICVKNANCMKSNISSLNFEFTVCTCESEYYQSEDGKCENKKSFDKACENSGQCLEDMQCDPAHKKCVCSRSKLFYPLENRCVVKVGYACSDSHLRGNCVPGAVCDDGICMCGIMQWFDLRDYGNCFLADHRYKRGNEYREADYGNCTSDTTGPLTRDMCPPGLFCINGGCNCPFGDHQHYDTLKMKCVSFIGGPCENQSDCYNDDVDCVDENSIRQCKCKPGLIDVNKRCKIAYGGTCNQTKPNCDTLAPLKCSEEGICECEKLQIYEETYKMCRGLVGALCEPDESKIQKLWGPFCVNGAACVRYRDTYGTNLGLCACKTRWITQSNRTCTETEE